jgi:hypothetical protein
VPQHLDPVSAIIGSKKFQTMFFWVLFCAIGAFTNSDKAVAVGFIHSAAFVVGTYLISQGIVDAQTAKKE